MEKKQLDNDLTLRLKPDRQNLHDSHHLQLEVSTNNNQEIDKDDIVVIWNGIDISKSFSKTAKTNVFENKTLFTFRDFSLPNNKLHEIEFYITHQGKNYYKNYEKPTCNIYEKNVITNTGKFKVDKSLINEITKSAYEHDINPSLLTGLIAAESSFKPRAVSSAKAIGLTQVTLLGHLEIQKSFPDWKIDRRTKRYPASVVKTLIHLNEIDANDDWRLNKEKSIRGGTNYLLYLKEYWEKKALSYKLGTSQMTNLILASYNSGAARVRKQLANKKSKWRDSKKLKEANKYINRISSYCYHFSNSDRQRVSQK